MSSAQQSQGGKGAIPHLLAHNPKDNVAVVVVEGLKAGTHAFGVITETNEAFEIDVHDDVPIGHKVALKDLSPGDTVIKYGEDVGRIVAPATRGHHVHTQNMKTKRW